MKKFSFALVALCLTVVAFAGEKDEAILNDLYKKTEALYKKGSWQVDINAVADASQGGMASMAKMNGKMTVKDEWHVNMNIVSNIDTPANAQAQGAPAQVQMTMTMIMDGAWMWYIMEAPSMGMKQYMKTDLSVIKAYMDETGSLPSNVGQGFLDPKALLQEMKREGDFAAKIDGDMVIFSDPDPEAGPASTITYHKENVYPVTLKVFDGEKETMKMEMSAVKEIAKADLDDSLFTFTPPTDAQVRDLTPGVQMMLEQEAAKEKAQ